MPGSPVDSRRLLPLCRASQLQLQIRCLRPLNPGTIHESNIHINNIQISSNLSLRLPLLLVSDHLPDLLGQLQVCGEEPVLLLLHLPLVHLQLLDLLGGLLHHPLIVVGEAPDFCRGDGGAGHEAAHAARPAEVTVAQAEVTHGLGEEAGAQPCAGAVIGLVLVLVIDQPRLLELHLVVGGGGGAAAGDADPGHSGVTDH